MREGVRCLTGIFKAQSMFRFILILHLANHSKFKEAACFVEFYGWFTDGPEVFLAMEFVQLGDLEKNVMAHSGKIPESEARDIAAQIISALEIMHAVKFAHRDLKPQVYIPGYNFASIN